MQDDHSPYRSPSSPGRRAISSPSSFSRSALATLAFLGLPMIGGIVGFIGYLFASTILDNREVTTEPSLSYGQQAGLISLPMCTFISAATGLGIAFTITRQYVTSVLILLVVSLCGWAINHSLWSAQVRRYGPDPSEAVLYYPPLACSGIALCIAVMVAAWATLKSRSRFT